MSQSNNYMNMDKTFWTYSRVFIHNQSDLIIDNRANINLCSQNQFDSVNKNMFSSIVRFDNSKARTAI